MLKKITYIFRFSLVGCLWTYAFLMCANYITFFIWNFNFLSSHSWKIIYNFWNTGGVIKTGSDYIFILFLFSLPFFWFFGWIYFLRVNYVNIILYPINAYNSYVIKKYGQESSRIVLKNVKSTQKVIEEIKDQLESIKPEKTKEAANIRSQIIKKLEQNNKKD